MRTSLRFLPNVSLALSAALTLLAQSVGSEPVGIVSQLKGEWTRVRDHRMLLPADEIFPNDTFRSKPSTNYAIRIAMFDGTIWSKICSSADPCDGGSYRLPTESVPRRTLAGFLTEYFSARSHVPIIFTASRGLASKSPKEAVLDMSAGAINLAPAIEEVPAGRWKVTVSDPTKSRDTGISQNIDWPSGARLQIGGLPPGVYALDVQSLNGEPMGQPAAVLLASPELAKMEQSEFESARAIVSRWNDVDSAVVRKFLVQSLYAIQMKTKP